MRNNHFKIQFEEAKKIKIFDLPRNYDCVPGQAVNVGVTMYVLSISSLSEVEMVLLLGFSLVLIMFSIEKSLALMFEGPKV